MKHAETGRQGRRNVAHVDAGQRETYAGTMPNQQPAKAKTSESRPDDGNIIRLSDNAYDDFVTALSDPMPEPLARLLEEKPIRKD